MNMSGTEVEYLVGLLGPQDTSCSYIPQYEVPVDAHQGPYYS